MADPKSRAGTERYADGAILSYLAQLHVRHDEALERAFTTPEREGMPQIMVGPAEGKLLGMLARLVSARRAVEVGTLVGYSTIHLARGLQPGGKLYTIENNPRHARAAEENLAAAGLSGVVEVKLGDAKQVLAGLEAEGPFDLVFIDADKGSYDHYGRWAAKNLRPGGLLLGDNAYYFRRLLEEDNPEAAAMRRFHEDAAKIFDTVCVPTPDGLLLGVKR